LPEARSGFYEAGPFTVQNGEEAWSKSCGPETTAHFDPGASFDDTDQKPRRWRYQAEFQEAKINALPEGVHAVYVAERVFAPSARRRELSLGSDDGFRLFVDGAEVAGKKVDRAVAADQDQAAVEFARGAHLLTLKIVNT